MYSPGVWEIAPPRWRVWPEKGIGAQSAKGRALSREAKRKEFSMGDVEVKSGYKPVGEAVELGTWKASDGLSWKGTGNPYSPGGIGCRNSGGRPSGKVLFQKK